MATDADWTHLHIALLPVFPLLALGLLVPLWHRSRPDLAGFATAVAWTSAFAYVAFYTGLDAVAGIAAGTAVEHAPETRRASHSRSDGPPGSRLVLHGQPYLLARGVWTMPGFALGFALLAAGVARTESVPRRAAPERTGRTERQGRSRESRPRGDHHLEGRF